MIRAVLGTLIGLLLGAILAPVLVWLAWLWLHRQSDSQIFLIEHWVIYLIVVLGGGFGALAGALIGLAGTLKAALRGGQSSSPAIQASPTAPPRAP
jgi:hypothetical protein